MRGKEQHQVNDLRRTSGRPFRVLSLGLVALLASCPIVFSRPIPSSTAPKVASKAAAPLLQHPVLLQATDEGMTTSSAVSGTDTSSPLQVGLSKIQLVRGRSQIIRFAQPIARLSIADPSLADVIPLSPDQILINGKLRGSTSLIVWDESGQEGMFDLSVRNDATELMEAVQAVAPNENVQARVTDDSFILSGQVDNAVLLDEIKRTAAAYGYRDEHFIDLTDTPVPQVTLDVRIAEANRSIGRTLRTSFNTRNGSFQTTRLGNSLDTGILPKLNVPVAGGVVTGRGTSGVMPQDIANTMSSSNVGGLVGGWTGDRFTALWDFLETTGKLNTLANPSLMCTHGRTASFLAGGEYPFVGAVNQNGSPIISFKEFGVKLNFTPWVSVRSGRIELKVQPEVSNLDTSNCVAGGNGNPICGLLKRSTDTTVQLNDGESLMISGILSREEQSTLAKVPFIANVPILGSLFKNSQGVKSDRELVVIVTPHIVQRNSTANAGGLPVSTSPQP